MFQHVLRLSWNVPEGSQPFKSPAWGLTQTLPRALPGPPLPLRGHIRRPQGLQHQFIDQCETYAHLLSMFQQDSAGEHALQEAALAPGTPSRVFPPYPSIGHYSPPSSSAASFKRALSPDPASRSPPWPSKGPFCRCLW